MGYCLAMHNGQPLGKFDASAHPNAEITRLILVRHAETEANVSQLWQGDLDAPLTERGQQQVIATAARLAQVHLATPIHAFYASPLPRAQSTAVAIAAATGLPIFVENDLREFSLGQWEGRSLRELREVEDLWGRWAVEPAFAPPNGESPVSFNQRATQILGSLAVRHPGQRLLVVTHGAFISSVLSTLIEGDLGNWRAYDAPNCAISILAQQQNGWYGELLNDISHLPPSALADYENHY